ncbi:uncharacterized protein LOC132697191 [Cylas formicarius]|uniref:uncharacterized protein LOC132697191 n=1 Tax=Cylas formicarius TaxID=197179 RepID=UPI0029588C25|nr:uncharacterized protein LOC132697191 [Cylas formicarius]
MGRKNSKNKKGKLSSKSKNCPAVPTESSPKPNSQSLSVDKEDAVLDASKISDGSDARSFTPLLMHPTTCSTISSFMTDRRPEDRIIFLTMKEFNIRDLNPTHPDDPDAPSHVIFFCIRLLRQNIFQPIGAVLRHETLDESYIISQCVRAFISDLGQLDLRVVATVTPPTGAFYQILQCLVEVPNLENRTDPIIYNCPPFENIIHLYDANRLVETFQNIFYICKEVRFILEDEICSATWSDVQHTLDFYNIPCQYTGVVDAKYCIFNWDIQVKMNKLFCQDTQKNSRHNATDTLIAAVAMFIDSLTAGKMKVKQLRELENGWDKLKSLLGTMLFKRVAIPDITQRTDFISETQKEQPAQELPSISTTKGFLDQEDEIEIDDPEAIPSLESIVGDFLRGDSNPKLLSEKITKREQEVEKLLEQCQRFVRDSGKVIEEKDSIVDLYQPKNEPFTSALSENVITKLTDEEHEQFIRYACETADCWDSRSSDSDPNEKISKYSFYPDYHIKDVGAMEDNFARKFLELEERASHNALKIELRDLKAECDNLKLITRDEKSKLDKEVKTFAVKLSNLESCRSDLNPEPSIAEEMLISKASADDVPSYFQLKNGDKNSKPANEKLNKGRRNRRSLTSTKCSNDSKTSINTENEPFAIYDSPKTTILSTNDRCKGIVEKLQGDEGNQATQKEGSSLTLDLGEHRSDRLHMESSPKMQRPIRTSVLKENVNTKQRDEEQEEFFRYARETADCWNSKSSDSDPNEKISKYSFNQVNGEDVGAMEDDISRKLLELEERASRNALKIELRDLKAECDNLKLMTRDEKSKLDKEVKTFADKLLKLESYRSDLDPGPIIAEELLISKASADDVLSYWRLKSEDKNSKTANTKLNKGRRNRHSLTKCANNLKTRLNTEKSQSPESPSTSDIKRVQCKRLEDSSFQRSDNSNSASAAAQQSKDIFIQKSKQIYLDEATKDDRSILKTIEEINVPHRQEKTSPGHDRMHSLTAETPEKTLQSTLDSLEAENCDLQLEIKKVKAEINMASFKTQSSDEVCTSKQRKQKKGHMKKRSHTDTTIQTQMIVPPSQSMAHTSSGYHQQVAPADTIRRDYFDFRLTTDWLTLMNSITQLQLILRSNGVEEIDVAAFSLTHIDSFAVSIKINNGLLGYSYHGPLMSLMDVDCAFRTLEKGFALYMIQ